MRVSVKVLPRSSKSEIIKCEDESLKVYLKESPTDGKANKALIETLAAFYNVKKSSISIITGSKSRKKIVEISKG
ncbi:DUF167 domain-containing protein [Candidatus Omnitrophota bacterium]